MTDPTFTTIVAAPTVRVGLHSPYERAVLAHAKGLVVGQAFDITLSDEVKAAINRIGASIRRGSGKFAIRRRSQSALGTVYRIHRIG